MTKRGVIKNVNRFKQVMDYSELSFERKITPTDLDFVLEFGGKELVIGEFKLEGAKVPYGQRRAIEVILDNAYRSGSRVLGFIARHNTDVDKIVPAHLCQVKEVYCPELSNSWTVLKSKRYVKELIVSWRKYVA